MTSILPVPQQTWQAAYSLNKPKGSLPVPLQKAHVIWAIADVVWLII
jgi:hypothetical protein